MSDEQRTLMGGTIEAVSLQKRMKSSYIDYAMSVIIGRALPSVADGLKPVHRRILYSMLELGLSHNKPSKKSARIVGDVIGKYHPHGDSAVYDALVRMAQPFSMHYKLVEGQGNFGSVDGDSPAAMRYTEAKLSVLAGEMLNDLDKDVVDFRPNYDESLSEPELLPAPFPNLLINGSSGIAVGMATSIPPHNMGEVLEAAIWLIKNRDLSNIDEINENLLSIVSGPDFPTGGSIIGTAGIKRAYLTGRGKIRVRSVAHIESVKNTKHIVVTEIPYQVNKANLVADIARLVREKRVDGITDIKDESDRRGIRVVISVKKGGYPEVILNQLYKYTALEVTISMIFLATDHFQPKIFTLHKFLSRFIDERIVVIKRRTMFLLNKAEQEAHILRALKVAIDNIDQVIAIIKKSKSSKEAKIELCNELKIDMIQSQAILDMKLSKLAKLERDNIAEALSKLTGQITDYRDILEDPERIYRIIIEESERIIAKYSDKRKTEIKEEESDFDITKLIKPEDMAVILSNDGYIRRTSHADYHDQYRGGKGKKSASLKENDYIVKVISANNLDKLYLFSFGGKVFSIPVYQVPEGGLSARGKPVNTLIRITGNDSVKTVAAVSKKLEEAKGSFVFASKKGKIKRTLIEKYKSVRLNGVTAFKMNSSDSLNDIIVSDQENKLIIATKRGQVSKFSVDQLRAMGRVTAGVTGIRLRENDEVISALAAGDNDNTSILLVTKKGIGKRVAISKLRETNRGGMGVIGIKMTGKDSLVGALAVKESDHILIVTQEGYSLQFDVSNVRVMGRTAKGVKIITLRDEDNIVSVAKLET